ncbi:MAG: helix-turn-helix transcriptional regulator [Limisphaerales bacterium]
MSFEMSVRRERTRREMSQQKLADKAELDIRNIQRIEAGQLNVLITTAHRIKEALGCSWDSLLE